VGWSRRCLGAVVACFVVSCGFGCAVVLGAETRERVGSFGVLSGPQGIAVDQSSGDVYVADAGEARVEKFGPAGEFILMFGRDVNKTKAAEVATQAEKDVCTAVEVSLDAVECQAGVAGNQPGAFTTPAFLAVDPSTHDVYVGDTGDELVSKFTEGSALVESWGTSGQLDGSTTTAGAFGELAGVAVDASGTLGVLNKTAVSGVSGGEVFQFEPDGAFTAEVELKTEHPSVVPIGLGVNAAGDIFKSNGFELFEFAPAGSEVGIVTATIAGAFTVDPASGDVYLAGGGDTLEQYAFNGSGEVLEPDGGAPCPLVPDGGGCPATNSVNVGFTAAGIAVSDATGDVFLCNGTTGNIDVYGPLVTIPDVGTLAASMIAARSVQLNGEVKPDGLPVTECEFEYVEAAKYEPAASDPYAGGLTAPCVPAAAAIPTTGETEVSAEVAGLTPGVTYDYRLVAGNANGANPGVDEHVETLPPPVIDSTTVSGVTESSVVLEAKVTPNGTQLKVCVFEYGVGGYEHSVPCAQSFAQIGAGTEPVAVSAAVSGLSASLNTYHWRLLVENAAGPTTGADNTFVYPTTGEGLPDGRAYELVTPAQKNGSLINDVTFVGTVPDVAADGSRVIASAIQCFAGAQACTAHVKDDVGSPYAFTRTPGGWVTTALSPPASTWSYNALAGYDASSATALFVMPSEPFGEDDFYVRDPETGGFQDLGPNTPREDGAHIPEGGRLSATPQAQTADYSHVAWESPINWAFDAGAGQTPYEYARLGSTQPLLVGVTGGEESHDLISDCVTRLGANGVDRPGTMSADGATVFFTAEPCANGLGVNATVDVPVDGVYARVAGESAGAHTVAVSRSRCGVGQAAGEEACRVAAPGQECGPDETPAEIACRERTAASECGGGGAPQETACQEAAGKPADAEFLGASADGSKAFFTSTQQLTDDASEDPSDNAVEPGCAQTLAANGCNLYEYDTGNQPGHQLVDVSAGDVSGGGPRVQGVMAFSPDGSHVYFVAKGVLTVAGNDRGQVAQDGANNLYLFERECPDGEASCVQRTVFITDLPTTDSEEWREHKRANVTPEGRYLVFLSSGELTADDDSVSGAKQVFRYDAQTGQLVRISVGDDGFDDDGNRSSPGLCEEGLCFESALIVPPGASSTRSDPTMSDDGSFVFFQSPVALTPGALNDVVVGHVEETSGGVTTVKTIYAQNVYEWHEGRVFLISDGKDVSINNGADPACPFFSVCLLGSDASGANVFFTTVDQLVGQDTDTETDIYDARVCTAASPCLDQSGVSPAECEGDSCQGAAGGGPGSSAPASSTFQGPGNQGASVAPAAGVKPLTAREKLSRALAACRRKRRGHKRFVCERAARRAYSASARKTGRSGNAGDERRAK
jgi:NHL repeat